jgi:hypothetical protein
MGELDPDLSDASLEKENLGLELTKTSSNVMRNPRLQYKEQIYHQMSRINQTRMRQSWKENRPKVMDKN